jgi:molecular chaperone DnaJ
MAEKRDYYEVLMVSRSATKVEIDRAYRKLAIKFHPDSNRDDPSATEKFKECSEAYEVLTDAEKRARYDQFGHAGLGGGGGSQFTDFDSFGDIFGDVINDFFGGGGGRTRRGGAKRKSRGADIRCDVTLTLEEAARGVSKEISFRRRSACETCDGSGAAPGSQPVVCATCGGRGQVIQSAGILRVQTNCPTCRGAGKTISQPCSACRGSGLVTEKATLTVDIPAGVDDGMRVRLQGEGEASADGGPRGDCYCFINVRPHELFRRDGQNLILQFPISYSQAALGAEVEVPTLDGRTQLRIDPGTQSGDVFRITGCGVVQPGGSRKGDLLVQTVIEVPKKLSEAQAKLLRELAELEHESVLPQTKSFFEKLKTFFDPESQASS